MINYNACCFYDSPHRKNQKRNTLPADVPFCHLCIFNESNSIFKIASKHLFVRGKYLISNINDIIIDGNLISTCKLCYLEKYEKLLKGLAPIACLPPVTRRNNKIWMRRVRLSAIVHT